MVSAEYLVHSPVVSLSGAINASLYMTNSFLFGRPLTGKCKMMSRPPRNCASLRPSTCMAGALLSTRTRDPSLVEYTAAMISEKFGVLSLSDGILKLTRTRSPGRTEVMRRLSVSLPASLLSRASRVVGTWEISDSVTSLFRRFMAVTMTPRSAGAKSMLASFMVICILCVCVSVKKTI
ncbi:hypothetical protein LPJ66_003102 [Kickxella alabastrina]|uniref:Uncharacterized protein n=1 Tax=Kickxella alabastrina TaxID=61397 RepID=A0ACC1IKS5_9FUNG|nr:hypothetical protein LPJ66_003102 [Kickxella alabastrina]